MEGGGRNFDRYPTLALRFGKYKKCFTEKSKFSLEKIFNNIAWGKKRNLGAVEERDLVEQDFIVNFFF